MIKIVSRHQTLYLVQRYQLRRAPQSWVQTFLQHHWSWWKILQLSRSMLRNNPLSIWSKHLLLIGKTLWLRSNRISLKKTPLCLAPAKSSLHWAKTPPFRVLKRFKKSQPILLMSWMEGILYLHHWCLRPPLNLWSCMRTLMSFRRSRICLLLTIKKKTLATSTTSSIRYTPNTTRKKWQISSTLTSRISASRKMLIVRICIR